MYYERLMEVTGLTKQAAPFINPSRLISTLSKFADKDPARTAHLFGLIRGKARNPDWLHNYMVNGQNMTPLQMRYMQGKLNSAYTNSIAPEGTLKMLDSKHIPGMQGLNEKLENLRTGAYGDAFEAGKLRGIREYRPDNVYEVGISPSGRKGYRFRPSQLSSAYSQMKEDAITNPALWS